MKIDQVVEKLRKNYDTLVRLGNLSDIQFLAAKALDKNTKMAMVTGNSFEMKINRIDANGVEKPIGIHDIQIGDNIEIKSSFRNVANADALSYEGKIAIHNVQSVQIQKDNQFGPAKFTIEGEDRCVTSHELSNEIKCIKDIVSNQNTWVTRDAFIGLSEMNLREFKEFIADRQARDIVNTKYEETKSFDVTEMMDGPYSLDVDFERDG